MPLYEILGSAIVHQDEFRERLRSRQPALINLTEGLAARAKKETLQKSDGVLALSTGEFKLQDVLGDPLVLSLAGLQPIGLGKPLSVIIRHFYTGRYPKNGWFGGARRDLLVTTAVRDVFASTSAAPRAVNVTKRRVSSATNFDGINATDNGTQLVFYSPAVTMVSTTVTLEMAFNDFPDELVSRIGGAIEAAGGIPLFGPYGPVLIGVGLAIKLVSSVANSLIDARAEFSASERLEFQLPDGKPLMPGYKLLCESSFDPAPYHFELGKGLVDKAGSLYAGDEPYAVLLVDGTKQDAFKDFTPTAASAALLERFLSQKEGSEVVIDGIVSAVKLLSDIKLRKEVDTLNAALQKLDPKSAAAKELAEKIKALTANISEPLLKPST